MKSYMLKLIIICMLAITLLSSCTSNDNQVLKQIDYNITKGENYTYYALGGKNSIDCETLSTDSVKYYFELDIYTEEQTHDFINKVETLRTFFEDELKISFDEPLSVHVSDKNTLRENNKKIFLKDLDLNNVEVTTIFLHTFFEEKTNYGLLYGLACYVNEKLYSESIIPAISTDELKKYYSISKNMALMDLSIPAFQTIFFTEEQNQYAYATSYYFVKDLIDRKGTEYALNLLKNSSKLEIEFDAEYDNEKNIWLESIGATEKCEAVEIAIRYEQNFKNDRKTYPYIIYTTSTISRFVPNSEFEEERTAMNYSYIKHYLTMYEQDIAALKEYLSPYFDTRKDAIDCYYGGDVNRDFYTAKTSDNNGMLEYIRPLWNGVHEFSHYLTWTENLPLWIFEGLAEYCSQHLENNDVYRMKQEFYNKKDAIPDIDLYEKNIANQNEKIENSFLKFRNEYWAYRNNQEDITVEDTVSWYAPHRNNEEGADLSYLEAASLINYLIKNYGEEKFFELYKDYSDSKLHSTYGKTFSELKEEWLAELNTTIMLDYVLSSDGFKITYTDTNKEYLPSKRSFVDIIDGNTYEYVDCGLARNKDDEKDPDANDFEGLELKGKIALIQRGIPGTHFFYKQVNNAAKAGAVGVIVYNNQAGYVSMSLKNVEQDIPAIAILKEDGEFLKNAKDKKVTISKDFFGIIDNTPSNN